ncbi:hypothetical protein ACFV3R_19640 [Streptomyces sp. NPDC059740]|uniref:hypothetical protein n=1 Tax=Streptomyces sp. NPDC059740 TaxID=3346926 RepID=UPI00365E7FB3
MRKKLVAGMFVGAAAVAGFALAAPANAAPSPTGVAAPHSVTAAKSGTTSPSASDDTLAEAQRDAALADIMSSLV